MTFFESLLTLLLVAVGLLQISRRLSLPYPAMLAAAGVAVAFVPGAPDIPIDPGTALALFVAPALLDAAFDFPPGAARRFWVPLVTFAVVAVFVTCAAVALLGHMLLGLPIAAAVALGAMVAPPDAAAATAVLNSTSIPQSTDAILKGESLFNDATALLLFNASLAVVAHGHLTGPIAIRLGLAAPGGVLFGIVAALLMRRIHPFVRDSLGGTLLQFCGTYLIWIAADHLGLSAVLSLVAYAMTLARTSEIIHNYTRMRVHSYAVWSSVVFALNVFAFLLMGMQVRTIVRQMQREHLYQALRFSAVVVLVVIVIRLVIVLTFNRVVSWRARAKGQKEPASLNQGILVGWSGIRGFVTLATAFALPSSFPHRDTVVLTAFSVVLVTLVVQGLTLAPLIRWLGLDQTDASERELQSARAALATVAIATLSHRSSPEAEQLRFVYSLDRDSAAGEAVSCRFEDYRKTGLIAIRAERKELERMRTRDQLGANLYLKLQEELDWRELTLLPEDHRQIEES
ncbi:cation:proton antiporter [Granulicella sibirica]|uniref:Na+/H+ antiporter n=1 Tax=Granulicella sibirica TaxID=2479048 RepID=A0A4Q0T1L7_9BACT|nr:cation:proton antiporter [Granulicella sibirica]RXH56260.1 Na+/H+ antiporter [Granulicella sibirica]